MKYLSVCSGIEAASVAWHPLGWKPVGFSEIDAFASAVLAHRFPGVPNYGDITDFRNWPIQSGDIDLLVGGTPCQSFSVAGLRRGLADPRGNIMLTYLALVEYLRPRWIVWENVPGVLSSGRGRDFGTLLGSLGQLGYGFAYRVLDAQWCRTQRHKRAVPQRRRRVFVVGCLGDTASAAAVLFERESVQRNPSSRGTAGKNIAGTIAARFGISRNNIEECVTVNTVDTYQEAVGALCSSDHKMIGNQYVDQDKIVVAYTKAKRAQSSTDDESWVEGVVAPTQNAFDVGDTRATTAVVSQPMGVDLFNGTMTGDIHVPLRTAGGHGAPAVAIPIHDQATRFAGKNGDKFNGKGNEFGVGHNGDPSPTLTQGDKHAVGVIGCFKCGNSAKARGIGFSETESPTLSSGGGNAIPVVAATHAIATVAPFCINMGGNKGGASFSKDNVSYTLATNEPHAMAQDMTVRRLTPRDGARLQGFPDDWTLVPWRKGMATDGNRYKAIGNSMAVNCMEWIGERIAAVEAR